MADINDRGDVLIDGIYKKEGTEALLRQAYFRRANGWNSSQNKMFEQIKHEDENYWAFVFGMALNNTGEVVANAFWSNPSSLVGPGNGVALRWSPGMDYGLRVPEIIPGSEASRGFDINDSGTIVGASADELGWKAFKHAKGANSLTVLQVPFAGTAEVISRARAIDNAGHIAGFSMNAESFQRAAYWNAAGQCTLIPISTNAPAGTLPEALFINNAGQNGSGRIIVGERIDTSIVNYKWWEPAASGVSSIGIYLPSGLNDEDEFIQVDADPRIRRTLLATGYAIVQTPPSVSFSGLPNNEKFRILVGPNKFGQIGVMAKPTTTGVPRAYVGSPMWDNTESIDVNVSLGPGFGQNASLGVRFEVRYGEFTVETFSYDGLGQFPLVQFTNGEANVTLGTRLRGGLSLRTTVLGGNLSNSNPVSAHWLSQVVQVNRPNNNLPVVALFDLKNGDVDGTGNQTPGTNVISSDDYILISNAFDTSPGDPNWDHRADLDGNATIASDDYLIFNENFDTEGDY